MSKIFLCNKKDLKNLCGKKIEIDEVEIAVFKIDDEYFATGNVCPHQKFRKLFEGSCENGKITCPMHGWKFDLRTGVGENGKINIYNLTVEDEKIFVELN